MTKIYCDKCKKETTSHFIVKLPCSKADTTLMYNGIWMKNYDLCVKCFNKLKKWIDEDE